jgi:cysteine desulfurase
MWRSAGPALPSSSRSARTPQRDGAAAREGQLIFVGDRLVTARRACLYWDWNATTPPHSDVLEAMAAASRDAWANPSSQHQLGRAARARIERVREQLAAVVAVHPRDVLFAGSGTEANNLALSDAAALVVSRLDHPSVVRLAEERAGHGQPVAWIPVPPSGRLEPDAVLEALESLPPALWPGSCVVLTLANHETGVIQDVTGVLERVRPRGARLHVDAAQALGKLPSRSFGDADSYTLVAHKIRGPQGIAALAWRGRSPAPVLLGGSQERGIRPGTLSGSLIAGFGAALERLEPARYAAIEPLRDELERALGALAEVNGAGVARLPHVSNLSVAGWSGERLVAALDVRGVCVSTGSACRVGTAEPSAAVAAMHGIERARRAIRISLGEDVSRGELDEGTRVLVSLISRRAAGSSGSTPTNASECDG